MVNQIILSIDLYFRIAVILTFLYPLSQVCHKLKKIKTPPALGLACEVFKAYRPHRLGAYRIFRCLHSRDDGARKCYTGYTLAALVRSNGEPPTL